MINDETENEPTQEQLNETDEKGNVKECNDPSTTKEGATGEGKTPVSEQETGNREVDTTESELVNSKTDLESDEDENKDENKDEDEGEDEEETE